MEQLQEKLGAQLFSKVDRLADQLKDHPHALEILAYIKEKMTR